MEQTLIEVNGDHFSVEYEEKNRWIDGNVYAAIKLENTVAHQTGWSYVSKTHGGDTYETLNDDCRIMFGFHFVWRGGWEGRIYFKDDEYWSEELSTMVGIWNQIEALLKAKIRKADPGNTYDD